MGIVIVMLVMLRMNVPIRNLGASAASSVEKICTDHDQFFLGLSIVAVRLNFEIDSDYLL